MYLSMNQSFRDTFGKKGYKISLSAGMTCPNRDGTLGTRGCIFCSGAGEFAQKGTSVTQQIEEGAKRIEAKNKDGLYIAYFQDFTNTYAPLPRLRELFYEAINHPRVAVLSVATRPDCLPREVLELLEELNRIKPVWVELGLQTIFDKTGERINRCHSYAEFLGGYNELKKRGINTCVHLILGLPGETTEMMIESAKAVARLEPTCVKLHLLHILKGTKIAKEYENGEFETLSLEEYVNTVANCLEYFSEETVIQRLTGDGGRDDLIAPLWSLKKFVVLNEIDKEMVRRDTYQGTKFKKEM
jgi:radical SAM protein (TIGR01212 family)